MSRGMPRSPFHAGAHARWLAALAALAAVWLVLPASVMANTQLNVVGCTNPAALTVDAPNGGGIRTSTADCTIRFGSSDGTAMLHAYQSDGAGRALARQSTGALDPAFGGGRVVDDRSSGNDEYRGTVVQPDGKIVVAGVVDRDGVLDMYVRRYLVDGTLDPTFANGGEQMMASSFVVRDLALADDGSIFVLGYGGNRVQVAKLTPTGQLDPSWNRGTWTNESFADIGGINAESLAIGSGGTIYVGGYTSPLPTRDFAVLRLTAEGTPDLTFDGDGLRIINMGTEDSIRGIAVQPDGKIVATGLATMAGNRDVGVVRLLPSGALDPTFGTGGKVTIDIAANSDYAQSIAIRPSGTIVIGGYHRGVTVDYDPFTLQLTNAGALDTTYGPSGTGLAPIGQPGTAEYLSDLVLDPAGNTVLAGTRDDTSLLIARVDSNGVPDTTFGPNGSRSYDLEPGNNEDLRGIAMGPDGRIVAVGYAGASPNTHAIVIALATSTIADIDGSGTDFGAGGNAFGACLRSVGVGATTNASTWQANSTCPATVGAWWNGIPAGMGTRSRVALTTGVGVVNASASLRFGLETSGSEQPGRYLAPISIDVIAPNLEPPVNTAAPSISGTPQAKQLLTASPGTWTGSSVITYSYRWQRCSPACIDIPGATASTYRPSLDDVGASLKVAVTATNSLGSAVGTSGPLAIGGAPAMTPYYITGFEHQTIPAYNPPANNGIYTTLIGTATTSIDTSAPRSGAASLRFTSSSNYGMWDVATPSGARTGAVRAYINVAAFPTANTITILELDAGNNQFCEIQINPSGQLNANSVRIGNAVSRPGPVVSTGRWYRLDMGCDMTTTNVSTQWSVDGVAQTTATLTGGTSMAITSLQLGVDDASGGATMGISYDDVIATGAVSDYPIGPGQVLGITPNGTATHTSPTNLAFSTNNGTSWTALSTADNDQPLATSSARFIDDWPLTTPAGSADLVRATTLAGKLDYRMSNIDATQAINGVSVLVAGRSGPGSGSIAVGIDAGAGSTLLTTFSPNSATEYVRTTSTTIPVTGTAWTPAAVDALRVQLSSPNVTDGPRVDAVMAEVAVAGGATPENTAAPTIAGLYQVGKDLTANRGTWTPASVTKFTYQWQRCKPSPTCVNVPGATSATYTLVAADQAATMRVVVSATAGGDTAMATSAETTLIGARAPTITAMDGFEAGQLHMNGTTYLPVAISNGSIGVSDVWPRNGRFAAKVTNDGGNGASSTAIAWPHSGAFGVMRASIRLQDPPTTGGTRELMEMSSTAATTINCEIGYDPATMQLRVNIGATKSATGPIIERGRWYEIDWSCDASGSGTYSSTLNWAVDGVRQTPLVGGDQDIIGFTQLSVGNTRGGDSAYTAEFDDVAISQTIADYPIGPSAIDALLPTQIGTHSSPTNFEASINGGASWTALTDTPGMFPGSAAYLDDAPVEFTPGTSGKLVRQTAAGGYLEYDLANPSRTIPPIAVRGIGVHSAPTASTTQNATLTAFDGAAVTPLYTGDPGDPAHSLWAFQGIMNTKPSGGPWTTQHIDDLRLRLSSTNAGTAPSHPWTHALLAEALYPIVTPPTSLTAPQVQRPEATITVGDTLTAQPGAWTSPSPTTRSWRWTRCNAAGTHCVPIDDATGRTYVPTAADVGSTLQLVEIRRNEGGTQTSEALPTEIVAP